MEESKFEYYIGILILVILIPFAYVMFEDNSMKCAIILGASISICSVAFIYICDKYNK